MGITDEVSLQGDLHIYSHGAEQRAKLVAQHYDGLLEDHTYDTILCLTRLGSDRRITDEIIDTQDGVGYPTVTSLKDFATETLQARQPDLEFLSDHERIELLAEFLANQEWEADYLQSAADHESFNQDVGELLIEMESRDGIDPGQYASPILQEIAAVGGAFQSYLKDRGYIDRPSLIPQAIAAFASATAKDAVPDSISRWGVILVADFEELAQVERGFLGAISAATDAPIIALAEEQSRILSSWRETGSVGSMADGLAVTNHTSEHNPLNAPEAIGQYLVTRDRPQERIVEGTAQVIETSTFREQVTAVADEIERLCQTEDYTYEDITVAYQDSSAPVEKTIRLLRRHGIPTTTVAVNQLGNDPAVRELYDVTRVCAASGDADEQTVTRDRLLALDEASDELFAEISEATSAAAGLWQWLAETQLKDRIGSGWDDIAARDQFQHVKDVLDLADFLEAESQLDGSWESYQKALKRAFRYSSTRLENIETGRNDGGVPVGTIYGLKHSSCNALFLLNVTDEDYPFTPDLTPLLPFRRLQEESQFPMLTNQTPADIQRTFKPAAETEIQDDPFHAYFAQVSRRLLGIGAQTASERLYFGIPQEGTDSLGTYNQPSRFLSELVDSFEFITPLTDDKDPTISSHGGASEYVVEHVDDTLEAARRASVGGETVDLDAYERELAAIQGLLDQPEAATVQEALNARIDFRQGRVRRD